MTEKATLTRIFTAESEKQEDDVAYLPWRNAEFVFNSVANLFDSEVYSLAIFKGLITSSGGLTESTLKASSNSLFEYLSALSKGGDIDKKKRFL